MLHLGNHIHRSALCDVRRSQRLGALPAQLVQKVELALRGRAGAPALAAVDEGVGEGSGVGGGVVVAAVDGVGEGGCGEEVAGGCVGGFGDAGG